MNYTLFPVIILSTFQHAFPFSFFDNRKIVRWETFQEFFDNRKIKSRLTSFEQKYSRQSHTDEFHGFPCRASEEFSISVSSIPIRGVPPGEAKEKHRRRRSGSNIDPLPPLVCFARAFKVVDSSNSWPCRVGTREMWNDRRCETQQLHGNDEKKKKKEEKIDRKRRFERVNRKEEILAWGGWLSFSWERNCLDRFVQEFLLSREFFVSLGETRVVQFAGQV